MYFITAMDCFKHFAAVGKTDDKSTSFTTCYLCIKSLLCPPLHTTLLFDHFKVLVLTSSESHLLQR